MHYTIIDMEKDPRCGQFAYFRGMTFPFAGLTVEMDITDMMAARGGRPFFLSMLYAVVRAANAVPQLRRRLAEDGTVVEYDWCAPSYTVMKPDGVYVYATVEGNLAYEEFVAEGQRRQRRGVIALDRRDPLPQRHESRIGTRRGHGSVGLLSGWDSRHCVPHLFRGRVANVVEIGEQRAPSM